MIAVITGIPGTGKTTVSKKAMSLLSEKDIEYEMVTYGDVMIDIAKSKDIVKDRDDMRKLDPQTQKLIQELAAESIAKKEGNVLVDTHCTIKTPRGYLPGLPEWVLRKLKPETIILVEADPKEIAQRRNADNTRTRDDEVIDEIKTHQEINRSISTAYSVFSGATVTIIQNPQGRSDEAASEMADVLT